MSDVLTGGLGSRDPRSPREQLEDVFFGERGMLPAAQALLRSGFMGPALVLLYSAIDVIANLSRDAESRGSTKHDFIDWCDAHLNLAGTPGLTGHDFYGARCAVLHSHSAESSMSRDGRARPIGYRAGSGAPASIDVIDERFAATTPIVQIEELLLAAWDGVGSTIDSCFASERQARAVTARLSKVLGFLSYRHFRGLESFEVDVGTQRA